MKTLSVLPTLAPLVIDGTKPQTRRLMVPQPGEHYWPVLPGYKRRLKLMKCSDHLAARVSHHWRDGDRHGDDYEAQPWIPCPHGSPGDQLRLLTTWAVRPKYDAIKPRDLPANVAIWHAGMPWPKPGYYGKSRPGRFCPGHLRHWLPLLDLVTVRCERVGEISSEDICAEGAWNPAHSVDEDASQAHEAWANLWNSIHAAPKLRKHNPYTGAPEACYVSYPFEDVRTTRKIVLLPHYVVGNSWVWVLGIKPAERKD